MRGEVELDGGVLVIKRIHVHYNIRAAEGDRGTIERVNAFHAKKCPIYLSIFNCIEISTDFEIHEPS